MGGWPLGSRGLVRRGPRPTLPGEERLLARQRYRLRDHCLQRATGDFRRRGVSPRPGPLFWRLPTLVPDRRLDPLASGYQIVLAATAASWFLFLQWTLYAAFPEFRDFWASYAQTARGSADGLAAARHHAIWGVTGSAILGGASAVVSYTLYSLRKTAHRARRLGKYTILKEIGRGADIYCLGGVAYWMLTGKPPFDSESSVEVLIDHVKTVPPPLSEVSEIDLPGDLEAIVMKCLQKRPSDRFQSASQLQEALEAVPLAEPWSPKRAEEWWTRGVLADGSATQASEPL